MTDAAEEQLLIRLRALFREELQGTIGPVEELVASIPLFARMRQRR